MNKNESLALEKVWFNKNIQNFKFWNEKITETISRQYKVSICITCMNRLDDLSKTLIKNIEDNLDYPKIEFLVLDYNSKDGLDRWIKKETFSYIEKGILNYYRTEDPKHYQMGHSRNIAFKLANGDIVNNVDCDNFIQKGFIEYINILANQQKELAIFAKSRRRLRGRLGFYKHEFINILGGYDESFDGYGYDDHDLMNRALSLGFTFMPFRKYIDLVEDHKKHKTENFKNKNWKQTELDNRIKSLTNLQKNIFKANQNKQWGKANLVKNFQEKISI